MPNQSLIIWCSADLFPSAQPSQGGVAPPSARVSPALQNLFREKSGSHTVFFSPDNKTGLRDADIAFGQPDPELVISSERLRWVHLTSAGYTRYDRDDVRAALKKRGAILTNSSHVYDEPCAQHALAMMLALARQLPQALRHQQTST